ncbi:hypothetical protein ASPWEDRAFT_412830 [Aspergillus wentii DTO 134E9]|uniref:Protein kinase domain-containing protein n=1 Tax=Aspergillus wentii DTO 134E9 TaxID=1073089 RepID=A0A1L9RNR8_ASPWE|nr:uncharacterized protein ASPWEDRAFT_412830 [Aspergillus wentii DTO 134E9]KAI9934299.1 hypothetical protein MW887_005373 [Aspergillus wentii]OJJ36564.1 hypothetical protein ASPWEDRAFT_412830 [Aspergillus wentii DTO 134E9]
MSSITSLWWPEDRVKATICPEYVVSQLQPASLPRLVSPLPWGEGLTSETYLDWIIAKAGRLFLILVDIGIPERIFALVDESFDDVDLPIASHSIDRLNLSPDGENVALDIKFFHAQWRFLVRGIGEGEHVKYTENEGVPVELQRSETSLAKEGVEKVILAGAVCKLYLRTRVTIGGAPHFFEEDEVLEEVRSLRRLSHEHVFSIYGSYFVDNTICILFSGMYERTLMSFLSDVPQHFKRLPKPERRQILINWPHCLASGLSWLHAHGQAHGAIRPSNIFVDSEYRIFLGQYEALDTLLPPVKVDDVQAYQYGAPERWVRSAAVQDTGSNRSLLPSGGRTGRKQPSRPGKLNLVGLKYFQKSDSSADGAASDSVASHGTAIRIGFPDSPSRFSFALSSSSSGSSDGSARKRGVSSLRRPIFYTPSISSSNSSGSSSSRPVSTVYNPVGLPSANQHAAVVHTWQSHQTNPEMSDMFSLGAVMLDIFTHLCKRKLSTFVHHRGAKNRTAGRGGGVADSSFHLDRNMGQVSSWITLLDHDAKKRKDSTFNAVRSMLAMVRTMLDKDPVSRPSAVQVEQYFSHTIQKLEGIVNLHCKSKIPIRAKSRSPLRETRNRETGDDHRPKPRLSNLTIPTSSTSSPFTTPLPSPSIIEPGGILHLPGIQPSPAASVSNFDLPAWSDSDDEDDEEYRKAHENAPWHDPGHLLSPMTSNDSALGYGVAVSP